LPEIIRVLSAEADFEAMDARIPHTQQHVAAACREALYARWGEVKPVGMVDYVVRSGYFGRSLVSAIQAWHRKDPTATDTWMQKVIAAGGRENPAWDSVYGVKANIAFEGKDYYLAWSEMMEMVDFSAKRSLQARIFNAWIKVDAKALDLAQKRFVREENTPGIPKKVDRGRAA
jgi:hypothetical protein